MTDSAQSAGVGVENDHCSRIRCDVWRTARDKRIDATAAIKREKRLVLDGKALSTRPLGEKPAPDGARRAQMFSWRGSRPPHDASCALTTRLIEFRMLTVARLFLA
ncbi:hypothetical protein IY145_14375 [Methylosinus sp. H3A]|uniref:hypothetical protein n=1 Tax=Methylosinus sp. H3A TaxID=2785786 RepID=UPI0018C27E7C|nr:hypothetical protein [Methylosinus sp. H3A]MBG0810555.1 hypothetical protein [Methylosinus sp. H3A]